MFSHDPLTEETRELLDKVTFGGNVGPQLPPLAHPSGFCAGLELPPALSWSWAVSGRARGAVLSSAGTPPVLVGIFSPARVGFAGQGVGRATRNVACKHILRCLAIF